MKPSLFILLLILPTCVADEITVSTGQIRNTIEASLPLIRTAGAAWISEKDCLSCHQIPFMVWSLNAAADAGIETDREQLADWNSWSTDWKNMASPETRNESEQRTTLESSNDTVAQLLIGLRAVELPPELSQNGVEALFASQQQDGLWKSGGQLPLQKRPKSETREVSSLWALAALASRLSSTNERLQNARRQFQSALKAEHRPQSTEWWAMRLVVADLLKDTATATEAANQLLKIQQKDGSWGWLIKDPGDALGTSMAVYALARHGMKRTDPAIERAISFLIESQTEEGGWRVNGTKAGSRSSVTDTAEYWGTCWAVIALCEVL